MPDTVEELNDLISKLNFLKKNFPDEDERRKRQQQFYGKVEAMDVDINSFESIEDAITSAEELKLKKEKEQQENGRETNFDKMLKSQRSQRRITIKKRPEDKNKFKPIDGEKLDPVLSTKRNRGDSNSSEEELKSLTPSKKRKNPSITTPEEIIEEEGREEDKDLYSGGRRTRRKLRARSRVKSRKKRHRKRRKSRRKSRRRKRRRKKRTKRRR